MSPVLLSPNADRSGAGAFTITGSASTIHGALSDADDSTFVTRTSLTQRGDFVVDLSTLSISASQAVESVRVGVRNLRDEDSSILYVRQGFVSDPAAGVIRYAAADQFIGQTASIESQFGAPRITAPDGQPWDQERINNLVIRVTDFASASAARTNVYELSAEVTLNTQPTLTVTAPTGVITDTSRPAVAWTYSDADNDPQSVYEVKVFTQAQAAAAGFDVDTSVPEYGSGLVQSPDPGVTVPIDLENGESFVAYARVGHPLSTGVFLSEWQSSSFSMDYLSAPPPALSALFSLRDNAVFVTARGRTNYLDPDDADLEGSVGSWDVIAGANVTRSTTQSLVGVASLSLEALSTVASMSARTDPYPIATDGQTIAAIADFRADAVARSCRVNIRWFDDTDSLIGTTTGSTVTDGNTGWTTATVTGVPPVGAVKAGVGVEVLNPVSGEVHYVDAIALHTGDTAVWSPGGLLATQRMRAERSLDAGQTWTFLNETDANTPEQIAQLDDFTAPRDRSVLYRVRAISRPNQDTIASGNSSPAAAFVTNDGQWWLKAIGSGIRGCPCPAFNVGGANVRGPIQVNIEQEVGVFRPLGRRTAVVTAGEVYGSDGQYIVTATTDEEWQAFQDLLFTVRGDILVQDPSGDQKRIRLTGREVELAQSFTKPLRTITLSYVQVD